MRRAAIEGGARGTEDEAVKGIVPPQSALDCARLGYAVLPLQPLTKIPVTENGLRAATSDVEQIVTWWRTMPRANLGLLPPAEVLVIDAETPAAGEALMSRCGALTVAPRCRTPRGGVHLYLRLPDGATAPPTRARALPDVDVRGLGKAYVVAPPSRTRRGSYTFEQALVAPKGLPVAPAELLAELTPEPVHRPERTRPTPYTGESVIAAFNAATDIHELLESHGYRHKGDNRYLPPSSQSGLAGAVILEGDDGVARVFVHNTSSPLADGYAHDAFDCYRILEHGGDWTAAVKAAADLLGLRCVQSANTGASPVASFFDDENGHKRRPVQSAREIGSVWGSPIKGSLP